jgi:hypothetical protein
MVRQCQRETELSDPWGAQGRAAKAAYVTFGSGYQCMTVRDIPRPGRRRPVSSKAVRDLVADAPFPASACRVTRPDHAARGAPSPGAVRTPRSSSTPGAHRRLSTVDGRHPLSREAAPMSGDALWADASGGGQGPVRVFAETVRRACR